MFKIKGILSNGKGFKLDAKGNTLVEAAEELSEKLNGIDAEVERVSFAARGATKAELDLYDAPKRERKESGSRATKKRGSKSKRTATATA